MVRIPGSLIALLTFPGFIMHELAHLVFCKLCGISVKEVKYLDVDGDEAFGYVRHTPTDNLGHQLLISGGPALIGLPLGGAIALPGYLQRFHPPIISSVLMWLGLSLMMHAFPSLVDARAFRTLAAAPHRPVLLRWLLRPVVWLFYAMGVLSGNLIGLLCCGLIMEGMQLHLRH